MEPCNYDCVLVVFLAIKTLKTLDYYFPDMAEPLSRFYSLAAVKLRLRFDVECVDLSRERILSTSSVVKQMIWELTRRLCGYSGIL